MVYNELRIRNVDFYTHTINIQGHTRKVSITTLVKQLHCHEHLNEETETQAMNEEEVQRFKFFNPRFLTAAY